MPECIGICSVYSSRPDLCREYPQPEDLLHPGCTFSFSGQERHGECDPRSCQESICCNAPRQWGEPEGVPLAVEEGGEPCKHLKWADLPEEKIADDTSEETADYYDVLTSLRTDHV